MRTFSSQSERVLAPLRSAIQRGDPAAIRAALPEPPGFLSNVFQLEPVDRDHILIAVFSVLDTDEDRWEIIEAAAMDSSTPATNALLSLGPYIPGSLVDDLDQLLKHLGNPSLSNAVHSARRKDI